MSGNCQKWQVTVNQLSSNCHTVVTNLKQLSEMPCNCQKCQVTVNQLSSNCHKCQATVNQLSSNCHTVVKNAMQLSYSCQKNKNKKSHSTFAQNLPSPFGRDKTIYKPSHFRAKLVRTHVPFLLSPLLSTPLYPPARDWRSTAVQKVASHYFPLIGWVAIMSFCLLYFCFSFCPSFVLLPLLIRGPFLCLSYCSTSPSLNPTLIAFKWA